MAFPTRSRILVLCFAVAVAIAVCDWRAGPDTSLGVLYLAPLLVSATLLSPGQTFICAIAATALTGYFGPASSGPQAVFQASTGLLIFGGSSVLVSEIARRKRFEGQLTKELQETSERRREAEEDAHAVIETSPAAILTVKSDGRIELANEAARRLLCLDSGSASSRHIGEYFPMLADMLKSQHSGPFVRAMMEGRGRRSNGEMFFAHLWLSSYSTPAGPKLAAVVADVSEQVRDREELGLRQLLMNSHIIAGAVSHEIRNLAAAAGTLHENVARCCEVSSSGDFKTLGHLIEGMRKLCSAEIPADSEQFLTGVDLNALFKELDIILKTGADDAGIEFQWEIADDLPRVRAHRSALLQVLLNLTQNSRRALRGTLKPRVSIAAYSLLGSVMVMVVDNGPGIASSETLFQPFQSGAASSGLGLYVSRAIIRSYGGELQYVRRSLESCFQIELPAMAESEVTAVA